MRRFLLVAGQVKFLDALGRIAIAAPDQHLLMEILVLVAHAADIQRFPRFQIVERRLNVVVDVVALSPLGEPDGMR